MSRSKIPALIIAAIMLLAGGWISGLIIDPAALVGVERPAVAEEDDHPAHDDDHEGHVHLSEAAYKNLKLRIRPVVLSDGKHYLQIPGEIIEKPGQSDHALSAPVNGVVTEVYALPGQAIRPNDPLFKLQVIDEPLATAQLNLLNAIARLTTLESELKRISPLADAGTVLGRKKLELEYEQNELNLKKQLYEQELAVRGLTEEQIAMIKKDRKLIRELVVRMPEDAGHGHGSEPIPVNDPPTGEPPVESSQPLRPISTMSPVNDWEYTIEELKVFPGKSVARGDDLCHVAYHTTLYVQGQIFENELKYITGLGEVERQDWTLSAVIGSDGSSEVVDGLRIHYVDNHVNPETQTYLFYVPLRNTVVRDTVDDDGRRFRTWRFKPGQRVHLNIPIDSYSKQIRLPRSAVASQGANHYVFREITGADHDDSHHDDSTAGTAHGHSHGSSDIFLEMERVPIVIEYENSDYVLVSPDGALRPGDHIAMNNAYQLYLEQKSQAGGDTAGHGHEH